VKYLILILLLSGCDSFVNKYKCKDNVTYVELDGAWVEAGVFKDRKCLDVK